MSTLNKIKPLSDYLLIEPLNKETTLPSGIVIPDTAKEKPVWGEVIAAGPGRISDEGKLIAPAIKVGDKVLYGKYSGTEVTVDNEELLIMRESDVFAIMSK